MKNCRHGLTDPGLAEHGYHPEWAACVGYGLVPVVELDPVTQWCFAHQDEVFTDIETGELVCARSRRGPCDIDDAAVIRIGEET